MRTGAGLLAVSAALSLATLDHLGALSRDGRRGRFDGLEARVISAPDGRTLVLDALDPRTGEPLVVRLWGIGPPGDNEAAAATLERLTRNEPVTLRTERHQERDADGRLRAHVIAKNDTVGAALIGQGLAAADRSRRHRDSERYAALELAARRAGRGIWSAANAGAP